VLIRRAIDYLPYFVFTFRELGRAGLGPGRGCFEVAEVHAEGVGETRCVYAAADGVLHGDGPRVTGADLAAGQQVGTGNGRLTVHFLTPTRIQSDGMVRAEVGAA
jgi:hypothetical protein